MTDEMIALARRAVACKGWRCMPGMLRQDGCRYTGMGMWANGARLTEEDVEVDAPDQWPDLTDPATLGCLLALVREAWGDPAIYASTENDGTWGVFNTGDGIVTHKHDSEAEALVAALEGAP
jgi:hypothetical protein